MLRKSTRNVQPGAAPAGVGRPLLLRISGSDEEYAVDEVVSLCFARMLLVMFCGLLR